MSPCVTSTSRLRESPLEVSRLKARSKLRNKSGLQMRGGEVSQPVYHTLTDQPSTLKSTKTKAKAIVRETLESDAATDEETGTNAGSQPQPPSKKNLVMPHKTEVISVIKGVVSGANAKSTAT